MNETGFKISLADLMVMFFEARMKDVLEEMHRFLDDLGIELEYDPSIQGIDFEQISDFLKEQNESE